MVSGSHGGLSAGRFALAAAPRLAVFNDAGVGKDGAGIAALALLQAHGVAACTVAHDSARIGEAASTFDDGVISHVNAAAASVGMAPGQPRTLGSQSKYNHEKDKLRNDTRTAHGTYLPEKEKEGEV